MTCASIYYRYLQYSSIACPVIPLHHFESKVKHVCILLNVMSYQSMAKEKLEVVIAATVIVTQYISTDKPPSLVNDIDCHDSCSTLSSADNESSNNITSSNDQNCDLHELIDNRASQIFLPLFQQQQQVHTSCLTLPHVNSVGIGGVIKICRRARLSST